MNIENRAQNQIRHIISVFEKVFSAFNRGQPIDNWLSNYFRANKNIGSKDRKRIANSIFGYFRWYGWLGKHGSDNISLTLLLAYLLDDNILDQTIWFWMQQYDVDISKLQGSSLYDKRDFVSGVLGSVSLSELNPDFVPKMPDEFLSAQQKRACLWVRLTNMVDKNFFEDLQKRDISYAAHPFQKHCVEIKSPINLFELTHFKKGLLEVQDIASQGVGLICNPKQNDVWWDVCAGSGGKALHLASLMENKGKVYASEIDSGRCRELKRRITKSYCKDTIEAILWNGTKVPSFSERPLHVLVDAPCSCSGTWRRSPELRWSISKDKISEYSQLQLEILKRAAEIVPTGGKLVYVTCSIFKEENELIVNQFLADHQNFVLSPLTCPFTGRTYLEGIHFQPPEIDGNAMFAAVLVRQ